ncbi:MAG: methylated-DNA--[protein]-cysteine S-methyltransferase [Thermoanaerobaculia bacterium]
MSHEPDSDPAAPGWALFDTAIGRCGIAWSERGVTAVQLPEASDAETRGRVIRRTPRAREISPPTTVLEAIGGIVALLRGDRGPASELAYVALDFDRVPEFERSVYSVTRTVPPGETVTYGEIAGRLGDPGASRAVGRALGRNPFVLVVPCHRVLPADGGFGGFSASGGTALKRRLLSIERARGLPVGGLFDDC